MSLFNLLSVYLVYSISIKFGGIGTFCPKHQTRKIDKIHKDFELYRVFMHNFVANCPNIPDIYIIHKKN